MNLVYEVGLRKIVMRHADLGQHFLIDREVLRDIIQAAELTPDDVVLEIGPGNGVLTEELAQRVSQVIAVELDRTLVAELKKKFRGVKNVTIVHDDILRWWGAGAQLPTSFSPATLDAPARRRAALRPRSLVPITIGTRAMPARPAYAAGEQHRQGSCFDDGAFKVVANIPYRITAPILRLFLDPPAGGQPRPALMVLMVQKEVAERVCAKPGDMSLLSVSVQYYAKPEIVRIVPRTAFDPSPNVDSAVLKIVPHQRKNGHTENVTTKLSLAQVVTKSEQVFFRLVKIGFSSRRKQLQNLLATGLHISNEEAKKALADAGLAPTVRAQELSVEDWKRIFIAS